MRSLIDLDQHRIGRFILVLIAADFLLCLIYFVNYALGQPAQILHNLLNLDGEVGIVAWLSSVQLFSIGILFLLAYIKNKDAAAFPRRLFLLLGVGFIFLSADESAAIHEKLSQLLRSYNWQLTFEGELGGWIPFYLLAGLVLILLVFRDLLAIFRYHPRAVLWLAFGFGLFFLGGVVLEVISYQFLRGDLYSLIYQGEVMLEEALELAGESLMLYGVLSLVTAPRPAAQTVTRTAGGSSPTLIDK